eukprot:COSAG01_NODE_3614_length_5866_cov_4.599619_1_plen_211_part_00
MARTYLWRSGSPVCLCLLRVLYVACLVVLSLCDDNREDSCNERFDGLARGMRGDAFEGEHDVCAHVFNGSDSPICPPGCQGNITALLRDCVGKDLPFGNESWDVDAAEQLKQLGAAECNYTVPPRPPAPPGPSPGPGPGPPGPSPGPGPGPGPGPSPTPSAGLPSWGVALIIAGGSGLVLVGAAAVVVRRRRAAQQGVSTPLLDHVGGSE